MLHTKSYHKGHPNPQKYRENYLSLDGEWDFLFDENDEGMMKEYYKELLVNPCFLAHSAIFSLV